MLIEGFQGNEEAEAKALRHALLGKRVCDVGWRSGVLTIEVEGGVEVEIDAESGFSCDDFPHLSIELTSPPPSPNYQWVHLLGNLA